MQINSEAKLGTVTGLLPVELRTSLIDNALGSAYHIWHLRIDPAIAGFSLMSRPRIYSIIVRKDLAILLDPEKALDLLAAHLPTRVPQLRVADMLVARPATLLEAENVLRAKQKLPAVTSLSVSWEYLLSESQRRPEEIDEFYVHP